MRRIALILLIATSPAAAQDVETDREPLSGGIEQLLRDLFSEIEPTLRELRETIGNLDDYEAPEMLPNGDIIIRRKRPQEAEPLPEEEEVEPDEPIEL